MLDCTSNTVQTMEQGVNWEHDRRDESSRNKCSEGGKGSWEWNSLTEQTFPEEKHVKWLWMVVALGPRCPGIAIQQTEQGQQPVPGAQVTSREGAMWQMLQADVSPLPPLSVPAAARWNLWMTMLLSEQEDCHGSHLTRT